jgi:hypothetical protein
MLLAGGLVALAFVLGGCDSDDEHRTTQEVQYGPTPDFNTRFVMPCPKCAAPQRPFRITAHKSYYRCTGVPPKFPPHHEKRWDHEVSHHVRSLEQ